MNFCLKSFQLTIMRTTHHAPPAKTALFSLTAVVQIIISNGVGWYVSGSKSRFSNRHFDLLLVDFCRVIGYRNCLLCYLHIGGSNTIG